MGHNTAGLTYLYTSANPERRVIPSHVGSLAYNSHSFMSIPSSSLLRRGRLFRGGRPLLRRLCLGGLLLQRAVWRVDLEEVVHDDQDHGGRAEEYGKPVEVVVGDHGEG